MSVDTPYTRTLARAVQALGGEQQLAEALGVPLPEPQSWARGEQIPPMHVFTAALDIVASGRHGDPSDPTNSEGLAFHGRQRTGDDMAGMPGWFVWTSGAELGEAVLTARKSMGLTQGALAARARVGAKFLYNLERGKGTLRVDKVMAVLGALGLMPLIVPLELLPALR